MNKTIATAIFICTVLTAGVFGQQEIPMFFDNEMMLSTDNNIYVAYSPDGSKIATVFGTSKIAIWDAATGRAITRLAGHGNQNITGIVFSPNGRQLASWVWDDSTIKMWDTTSGALIRSISQVNVNAVSFSPDGNRIAGAYSKTDNSNGIKIWNTANGSEVRTLSGHTDYIWSVRYSPDGRQILTASTDNSIRIWNSENGQTLRIINGEAAFGNAVYSPDGRRIVAYVYDINSGYSVATYIFNTETGKELITISGRVGKNLVYSPDGKQLLINTWDNNDNGLIKIFDPDTGRELRSFNNGDRAVAFSPDGRRILTDSTSFRLRLEVEGRRRLFSSYASYATLLDATTGKVTGTIGYGPLNVGARAYADLQIARFLGDTAAVNRHEAVLQFITGRGNATRAEIEKFYRDNVRSLIAAVVDSEFKTASETVRKNDMEGIPLPPEFINEVKQHVTNFFLSPTTANFNRLKDLNRALILRIRCADAGMAYALSTLVVKPNGDMELLKKANDYISQLEKITGSLSRNGVRPSDGSALYWSAFWIAYSRILRELNPEIEKKADVPMGEIP